MKRIKYVASHTLAGLIVAAMAAFFMAVYVPLGLAFVAAAILAAREWGQKGQKMGAGRHNLKAQVEIAKSLFATPWALAQWALPGVLVAFVCLGFEWFLVQAVAAFFGMDGG